MLPEICRDEAVSGKLDTDERPGLERAMSLIRAGRANVLVVHKIDRFFHNVERTFRYVNELEGLGAGLVCTQQPIDTTNPVSGKIVPAVMAALAEIYLDNLSEETAMGKRARAAAGLPNGDLPYGYRNPEQGTSGQSNRAVPVAVPEQAGAVRRAFEWYATGQWSDARVARALNAEGYRIISKWQPQGGPFGKDTITALLTNPFYAGWVVQPTGDGASNRSPDAPLVRGMHEPIIPADLYDAVQAVRATRRGSGRRGSPALQAYTYVGAGIVHCRACLHTMRAQGQARRGPTFRCTSHDRGLGCTCRRKSIPAPLVEEAIGAAVAGLVLAPDWRERILTEVGTAPADHARMAAQRLPLERKRERLQRLLIDGDLDQETYRRERAALDADLARLVPVPTADVDMEKAARVVTDPGALYAGAAPADRRTMAALVFEAVYCDTDARRVVAVQINRALQPLWSALPRTCTQCGSDGI